MWDPLGNNNDREFVNGFSYSFKKKRTDIPGLKHSRSSFGYAAAWS